MPFALVGVNIMKHEPKALKTIMAKEKLNWRSFTNDGKISRQWNSPPTPAFYVIDGNGAIRRKWIGHPGEQAIDAALKKLIADAEKSRTKRSR